MNQAEEILNKYGFAMKNPNYAEKMHYRMKELSYYVMATPEKDGIEKVQSEKMMRAFAWQAGGIYISDVERFNRVFETDKFQTRIPMCLLEVAHLYVTPNNLVKRFTMNLIPSEQGGPVIDQYLAQGNPQLVKTLRKYHLQKVFVPDENPKSTYIELIRIFSKFSEELDKTEAKKRLTSELFNHLMDEFVNPDFQTKG